jgi:hypothetical protein
MIVHRIECDDGASTLYLAKIGMDKFVIEIHREDRIQIAELSRDDLNAAQEALVALQNQK